MFPLRAPRISLDDPAEYCKGDFITLTESPLTQRKDFAVGQAIDLARQAADV